MQERERGEPAVRIVLWNIAWRRRQSPAGRVIADVIEQHAPDLVCLTEAHTDFLPNGHLIHARADYGYPLKEGRRKVLLWSRQPWTGIDDLGDERLPPGRFVAGTTETQLGSLRMIGMCVPWPAAHVATGRKDRRPWEDHLVYLQGLSDILAREDHAERTLVVGDVNQFIPRKRASLRAFQALTDAIPPFLRLATEGAIPELDQPAIDHLWHTADLRTVRVGALPGHDPDGRALSDHVGLFIEIQQAHDDGTAGR
ncbi:endonuclease/exonuclease/phosphatase family protein [Geminicoccus flavidas]|uniref:endonuclease/exonuclease/phosphatase family protein n=1 Tax=Geminicoccus flavidas TaxID=2506407 RepID=UPI00135CE817|nr:endonuclease/exonuclease/phosphatase family protein [Geminicoccus flavidas]